MGHNHEHLNSGKVEYYTPPEIIEAARRTMGEIDLDPASCLEANQVVRAAHYFTRQDDGMLQDWHGRVWLNHPFDKNYNGFWMAKLYSEYVTGGIEQACCITWANVDTAWFRILLQFPQCFPNGRINYWEPGGGMQKGAPKGSVITYLGDHVGRFAEAFKDIGTVKVPYDGLL